MNTKRLVARFCLFVCFAAVVWAQATSQIQGTIQDATGAAVPGAEVKVTQTDTGATRAVNSGGDVARNTSAPPPPESPRTNDESAQVRWLAVRRSAPRLRVALNQPRKTRTPGSRSSAVNRARQRGGTIPVGWFGNPVSTVMRCPRPANARAVSSTRAWGAPISGG